MAIEYRFRDVELADGVRSWCAVLKTINHRDLTKHLASQGLELNLDGASRSPDAIDGEWDDDQFRGRILRGGSRLIGTFIAREVPDDELIDSRDDVIATDAGAEAGAELSADADAIPY